MQTYTIENELFKFGILEFNGLYITSYKIMNFRNVEARIMYSIRE